MLGSQLDSTQFLEEDASSQAESSLDLKVFS